MYRLQVGTFVGVVYMGLKSAFLLLGENIRGMVLKNLQTVVQYGNIFSLYEVKRVKINNLHYHFLWNAPNAQKCRYLSTKNKVIYYFNNVLTKFLNELDYLN